MTKTVKEIGEQGLLERLLPLCAADIVGDDGAVVKVAPGQSLVVTTDVLVDEVHFSDRTTSPEDVGWRAAAANLSDLAAMGAEPLGITVGLSLPGDVAVSWVKRLYQGLNDCLQNYGTNILGGDVCRSSVITVAITAFGQVLPSQAICRSAAQPGDEIVVTGPHGASRAGLELLLHSDFARQLEPAERQALIEFHTRPKPRLDVVKYLRQITGDRVAGMDSSDGLADAIVQTCGASGVGAEIEASAITMPSTLRRLVKPEQALQWALYGGEDFELVLCLEQHLAKALVERLGEGAAIIGRITTEQKIELTDSSDTYSRQILTLEQGFQHF